MPGTYGSPALKMRTSADSSQPERASLESCCSASSAHGTARTEAQRLRMIACPSTSNFQSRFRGQCRAHPAGTHPILGLRLKFQVAKQASSTNLCASVRAGPWADEAEQQLSRLAPSACQLSADISIVRAGLLEARGRDPLRYV